ncbi:MAG: hypothetical protein EOO65_05245, partial [Methanosarcinales archaeon]
MVAIASSRARAAAETHQHLLDLPLTTTSTMQAFKALQLPTCEVHAGACVCDAGASPWLVSGSRPSPLRGKNSCRPIQPSLPARPPPRAHLHTAAAALALHPQ